MNLILEAEIFTFPMLSFIAGLFFCFLGRKILGIIVAVFGFLIGFSWLSPAIADISGIPLEGNNWLIWFSAVLGAILGLVTWIISIFFAGTVLGIFLARGLLPEINGFIHVVIGLIVGFLMNSFKEPVSAFFTSFAGAYVATGSAMIMLNDVGFSGSVARFLEVGDPDPAIAILLMLLFTFFGYKFQSRSFGS